MWENSIEKIPKSAIEKDSTFMRRISNEKMDEVQRTYHG